MQNTIHNKAATTVFVALGLLPGCHLGGQSFDDGKDGLEGVRTKQNHGGPTDAGRGGEATPTVPSSSASNTLSPEANVSVDAATPDSPIRGADACDVQGEAIEGITTKQAFGEHMTGRWIFCSGFVNFAAHDGLEIRADGTWALLRYDAAGALVWQSDPDLGGTWSVDEYQAGTFQFRLTTYGATYNFGSLEFERDPSLMLMTSTGGFTTFARE